jgi:hypothetical protein
MMKKFSYIVNMDNLTVQNNCHVMMVPDVNGFDIRYNNIDPSYAHSPVSQDYFLNYCDFKLKVN